MACCDWDTFETAFRAAWQRYGAGEALIDWPRARRAWARHHCTGGEAAATQRQALCREGDYLWLTPQDTPGGRGGQGIPAPAPHRPVKPVSA